MNVCTSVPTQSQLELVIRLLYGWLYKVWSEEAGIMLIE